MVGGGPVFAGQRFFGKLECQQVGEAAYGADDQQLVGVDEAEHDGQKFCANPADHQRADGEREGVENF